MKCYRGIMRNSPCESSEFFESSTEMFTSSWNDSLLASTMDFRSWLCKEDAFYTIILTITYCLNASKHEKWNMRTNKSIALLFTALSLPITVLPASSPASPPSPAPAPAWVLAMVRAWEGLEPEASPPPWSSSRRWSTGSPAFTSNTSSSLEASSVPGELRISGHAQAHTHTQIHTQTRHTHTHTLMDAHTYHILKQTHRDEFVCTDIYAGGQWRALKTAVHQSIIFTPRLTGFIIPWITILAKS